MSRVRWNEVVALFGGRFDPPHLGHLEAVLGLFKFPGVRETWVLPSPSPPHKPAVASIEDRVSMVELLFHPTRLGAESSRIRVDRREIERSRAQPGLPSYSFDTIQAIRREISQPAFVVGADQLESLHQWYRFPMILGLCHWIILCRKPDGLDISLKTIRQWESSGLVRPSDESNVWRIRQDDERTFLMLAATDAPEVSSTAIREAIGRSGEPPAENLSPEVQQYLKRRRLYGSVAPKE